MKLRNHSKLLSHISILTIGCHRGGAAPNMSNKLRNRAFIVLKLVYGIDESMPQRMERFLTVTGKSEDFAKVVFVKPFLGGGTISFDFVVLQLREKTIIPGSFQCIYILQQP